MPTETELIDQLRSYGQWLEEDLRTVLRPAPAVVEPNLVAMDVVDESDSSSLSTTETIETTSSSRQRHRLAVAALTIIVAAGLTAAWPRSDRTSVSPAAESATTTSPTMPPSTTEQPAAGFEAGRSAAEATPDPLFVLPETLGGFARGDFGTSEVPSGDTGPAIVVGRSEATGFSDVASIASLEQLSFTGNEQEVTIDGVAVLVPDYLQGGNGTIGLQMEDGRWLEVSAETAEFAVELVAATTVVDGELHFRSFDGIDVISRVSQLESSRFRLLFLHDVETGDFASVGVESNPDLTMAIPWPGDVRRIDIRGRTGHVAERTNEFGDRWTGVAWMEAPGQAVTVLTTGRIDAVALAERLRVVDEATWRAELDAMATFDPGDRAIGEPIGTFELLDDEGAEVDIAPDGAPLVVVAGASSCRSCFADLAAISARVAQADPAARVIAVRLDADQDVPLPEDWTGPIYTLPEPDPNRRPFHIADALDDNHALLLDGEHTSIARIDLADEAALDRLAAALATLVE